MATVDELVIAIKADTKDLNKKLDKTNKQLKKTGTRAEKAGKKLKAGLSKGKVGAIALTAVLVKMATIIAKVGMEFEDLKDSLDVVFGSMKDGDKAMKRVFEFASTTPFQVETVTKAFIALKSVGIEPTNKMLQTFADTASVSVDSLGVFEALVRTVQRSAAGGLGLEELNMLSDRGIPALKILSEELGLTKDDIAKFGKTVEGAKLITDALQEGLNKRFGGAMENKMDNLSTKTSNMTIAFKLLADEIFKSGLGEFFGDLADSLRDVAEQAARAIAAAGGRGTGVALRNPNSSVGDNATQAQKKSSRISTVLSNIADLEDAASPLQKQSDKQARMDETNRTKYGRELFITSEESNRLKLINEELAEQVALLQRIKDGKGLISEEDKQSLMRQGELQHSLTFINGLINKEIGSTDSLAFAKANLTEIYTENQEALNLLGFDEQKIIDLLDKHSEATEKVATFSDEMQQAIASSAATFSKEFVDSLLEGENALESFQNLAKNIVSQIISTFLQLAVVNNILNAVFGAGTFDSMGMDGKITKATPVPKAGGGTVQKGVPTMVGERGAEIFVPNTGGAIMNNMNSKGMGGGTTVVVNQSVNFATGVVPTVRAEVQKMMPQISEVTKGAVLEAAVRGGSFRRGLQGG